MAKIKDSELKAILAEVEEEIGDLLKSEKDKLSKAAPPPMDEPPMESPEASSAAPGAAPPPPAAEGSAEAPEASSAAPGEAPGEEAPAGETGEIHPADDQAGLQSEYEQLSPEELKMHFLACKAAVEKLLGGQGADAGAPPPEGGMEAAAPPMSPSAPPALKSETGLESIQPKGQLTNGPSHLEAVQPKGALKSEMKHQAGSGGEMVATKKSQEDIADLKKKLAEQNDSLNKVVEAVTKFIGRPERKAVVELAPVAKSERSLPTTRAEVNERLKELTGPEGKLSKKDRALINGYCVGEYDVSQIQHLLK